jgi:ligand-binding sensor domain-containing protein/serine phosphatase RsbU (regulator of sigma subunit)
VWFKQINDICQTISFLELMKQCRKYFRFKGRENKWKCMNTFSLFLLLAFGLNTGFLNAQTVSFRHLNIENGLSQNTGNEVVIDHAGFVWIATSDGLNRYDGNNLRIFRHDPADSNSLSENNIRTLFVDSKGFLWIGGVTGGLNRYDPQTGYMRHFPTDEHKTNSLNTGNIGCIMEGDDGTIYVGTLGKGIAVIHKDGKITALRHSDGNPNSLPNDYVRTLAKDKDGRLWIGQWGVGVTCYDPKSGAFKIYSADGKKGGIHSNNIRSVFADKEDRLWISTWPTGFDVMDLQTGLCSPPSLYPNSPYYNSRIAMVWKFMEDAEGYTWLATAEEGLFRYDSRTHTYCQYKNNPNDPGSLSDNNVLSVQTDRSGQVWAGTWSAGVNILNPHTLAFGHYQNDPEDTTSVSDNTIWSVNRGKTSGKIWLGTSAGVCEFLPQEKKFRRYKFNTKDPNAPHEHTIIQSLCEDVDGNLWIGSNGGGLFEYVMATQKFTMYKASEDSNTISTQTISALLTDKKGTLWIGTAGGGIDKFIPEEKRFKRYFHREKDSTSLSGNFISSICENKEGKLWIGTEGQGLSLFDPVTGKSRQFFNDPANPHSLSSNIVFTLFIDKSGLLWIGTSSGLDYYDGKTFGVFTVRDGLPNDVIYSITEDESDNLWISTNKGIARFNPFAHLLKSFEASDGLQSNEFNQNVVTKLKDGRILMGGVKGLNCFLPSEILENKTVPPVVITRFSVLNKSFPLSKDISYTDEIKLSYKDYFFSIEFAALEFTNPSRNRYKYKMEGFNEEWVDIGNLHSATFTNLDPGEYVFKVAACNNDGVWNEKGCELRILITPPFWRTKWFYALCLIFILIVIYSYIRSREQKLLKEKIVLKQKVEERTQELTREKLKVEIAHKDIKDSINYAKRIQEAILPLNEEIEHAFPDSFVLFKPRDVVSGDFYWFTSTDNGVNLIAAADCTGHGVPGAFMSMIGNTLLNDIVRQKGTRQPSEVLNELHTGVRQALQQDRQAAESRDGMDIALCAFRSLQDGAELEYAGANRSLLIISAGALKEIKADKFPIGGLQLDEARKFTNHVLKLKKGDLVYIFSDGYPDQFGGEKGKKFMLKHFQNLLLSIRDKTLIDQKAILAETLESWRGELEQVDDILVIGIRV